jgi:phage-related protein
MTKREEVVGFGWHKTPAGDSPARADVLALPKELRAAIGFAIDRIQRLGLTGAIDEGVKAKGFRGKLWQLTIKHQRVLFVIVNGPKMVVVHTFDKNDDKTKKKHIEIAMARMKEVLDAEQG